MNSLRIWSCRNHVKLSKLYVSLFSSITGMDYKVADQRKRMQTETLAKKLHLLPWTVA